MGNRRKWLILSFFTDVDGLACSQHVDDRIKALRDHGIEPVVVSSVCSPKTNDYCKRRTHCFAPSGLRFELRYSTTRRFPKKAVRKLVQALPLLVVMPIYFVESKILKMDSTWSWWLTAYRAAMGEARRHDVEMIYSTGGPASAHLAASLVAERTGLPWIAEYQDPIVGEWVNRSAREVSFHCELEKQVAAAADGIIFMTETALADGEKRNPSAGRAHFVKPGANHPGFEPSRTRGDKLVIGHFGSLSGTRDIIPVLKAMTRLVESVPAAREHLCLLIMGSVGREQEAALRAYPYPEMIDMRGKRSRKESLAAMSDCDMLLLLQDTGSVSAVTIPSKAYEYMLSGVPILGLTCNNPELAGMLAQLGHRVAEVGDVSATEGVLSDVFENWSAGEPVCPCLSPSPYTTDRAATQMVQIADRILSAVRNK